MIVSPAMVCILCLQYFSTHKRTRRRKLLSLVHSYWNSITYIGGTDRMEENVAKYRINTRGKNGWYPYLLSF